MGLLRRGNKIVMGKGAQANVLSTLGNFMENKASPPFAMSMQAIRGVNARDNKILGFEEPFGYDLGKRGETINR